ncbi:MAG: prolyl-tRNA synthetase associated domain-containing protein [Litorimonas sp.]
MQDASPVSREYLFTYLDKNNIPHDTIEHEPSFTVEDGAELKAKMRGANTKNLFLKDKAGAFFLICAQSDTEIKINKLHGALGCKRLSFGKPEYLLEHLGVTPGSVTLFSVINDTSHTVQLIIDEALTEHDIFNFHPLLNNATTAISSADMIKFAKATGHNPIVIDFGQFNH